MNGALALTILCGRYACRKHEVRLPKTHSPRAADAHTVAGTARRGHESLDFRSMFPHDYVSLAASQGGVQRNPCRGGVRWPGATGLCPERMAQGVDSRRGHARRVFIRDSRRRPVRRHDHRPRRRSGLRQKQWRLFRRRHLAYFAAESVSPRLREPAAQRLGGVADADDHLSRQHLYGEFEGRCGAQHVVSFGDVRICVHPEPEGRGWRDASASPPRNW